MKINFGIRVVLYQKSFEPIKEYVLAAEKFGYSNIWVNDHLLPIVGSIEKPMMEAWTVISSLAPITHDIRLGTLVLNNAFRYPQLIAKMAATLDIISNGRLEIGIGGGWFKKEFEMFGFPYQKHSERIAMLSEAVELLKNLWSKERTTYNGKYYHVNDAVCLPKPLQKPYPPLLIGGHSTSLLHLVAKHADKSNFLLLSSKDFAKKAELLKKECNKVGRSYSKIKKSLFVEAMVVRSKKETYEEIRKRLRERGIPVKQLGRYAQRCIIGTPERCIQRIKEYVDANEFMLVFPNLDTKQIKFFADSVMACL